MPNSNRAREAIKMSRLAQVRNHALALESQYPEMRRDHSMRLCGAESPHRSRFETPTSSWESVHWNHLDAFHKLHMPGLLSRRF